jgi:hypothetical protein
MIIFPQFSLASLPKVHKAAEKWKSLIRKPGWPMKWQSPIFVNLPSAFRPSTDLILERARTTHATIITPVE